MTDPFAPAPESAPGGADPRSGARAAEARRVGGHAVRGVAVDGETRCAHYRGPDDVLAIRFACCREWFPCHACHAAVADHAATVWARADWGERALLCGRCGQTQSIARYLRRGDCAGCGGAFNPGCALHRDRYFAVD